MHYVIINTRMVAVENYMFSSGRSFFLGHIVFHLFVKTGLSSKHVSIQFCIKSILTLWFTASSTGSATTSTTTATSGTTSATTTTTACTATAPCRATTCII